MSTINGNLEALKQLRTELEPTHRDFNRLDAKTLRRGLRLPRLAVVGEASCGKSSVLEALTHIRFPVKEQNGTLFTTAVILRCTAIAKADAKITTGDSSAASGSIVQPLERNRGDADPRDLAGAVEQATRMLGLQDADSYSPQHGLYVKVSGPDLLPFFITDLPGICWDEEKRNSRDAVLCRELAEREMANPDVIILAVVSAEYGPNTLKILDLARKYDPKGERTLGVITKPDLALSEAHRLKFANIAQNTDPKHRLDLGWHILRNRSCPGWQISSQERDWTESEFFRVAPWSSVPQQARGAWMLRLRLGRILQASIYRSLPELSKAAKSKVEALSLRHHRLGPPLSTVEEARSCMVKVAARFQTLLAAALRGDYSDAFFFSEMDVGYGSVPEDSRVRKLRSMLGDLNGAFALVMVTKGAKDKLTDSDGLEGGDVQVPKHLKALVDFYQQPEPSFLQRDQYMAQVENTLSVNTTEAVISTIFREQASQWESLATTHIDLCKSSAKTFVECAIINIVGIDNKILGEVLKSFVDPFFVRVSMELEMKLQELLRHFTDGYLQPHETNFRNFLYKQRAGAKSHHISEAPIARASAEAVLTDMAKYYNLALPIFTENVIVLAVENCLISQMADILTIDRVLELNDDDLEPFATETEEIKQRRTEIEIERFEIKECLSACQKHLDRGFSGTHKLSFPSLLTLLVSMAISAWAD
ncbi:P-loop containing nucleoside triphosphate hydrolase protein [Mariannaea sp. PMI_226]|nr:P-loop containing nucleoside triphosphate hydrolase protein [Mariannaea sp. PMI_226]